MAISVSCIKCDTAIILNVDYNEVFNANCPKCGCAKFDKVSFVEFVSEVKDDDI